MKGSMTRRFFAKTDMSGNCWIWTGSFNSTGYGELPTTGTRHMLAHRFSFEFFNGPIPAGMGVCHRCDNPKCVNPAHLWIGDQRDNLQDAARKGRMAKPVGEASPKTSVTFEQAIEVIRLYNTGLLGREITARTGVNKHTLYDIATGRNGRWPHLQHLRQAARGRGKRAA